MASMTDIDLGMGQQNQGGGSVGASFQVAANSAPRGGQPPPPSYPSGGRSGGNEDGGSERGGPGGGSQSGGAADGAAPKRPAGIGTHAPQQTQRGLSETTLGPVAVAPPHIPLHSLEQEAPHTHTHTHTPPPPPPPGGGLTPPLLLLTREFCWSRGLPSLWAQAQARGSRGILEACNSIHCKAIAFGESPGWGGGGGGAQSLLVVVWLTDLP